jgi:hypothetical protein
LASASTRQKFAFLVSTRTCQNGCFQKYVRLARLADIRQAVLRGLARLAYIRQAVLRGLATLADTRRHSPSHVAWTRQTRKRRVWRVLREFGESGEFGELRLERFIHIKYVICAKNDLSYHAPLCQHLPRVLARLADIHQAVLHGLADIRPAVLRGLTRLADTHQRPFLRKM